MIIYAKQGALGFNHLKKMAGAARTGRWLARKKRNFG
jgi:hypothetical protein